MFTFHLKRYLTDRNFPNHLLQFSSIEFQCIGWHQTGECHPDGKRERHNDKPCDMPIQKKSSGYCQCLGGGKENIKECGQTLYTNCSAACSSVNGE